MKKLVFLPLLLVVASCGNSREADDFATRDSLYHDVCALLRTYTDSMALATDTAAADSLTERFEAHLQSVNMHYPPGTDKQFTEDLNDTVYMLTQRLVAARKNAISPRDTTPSDTLADTAENRQKGQPGRKLPNI